MCYLFQVYNLEKVNVRGKSLQVHKKNNFLSWGFAFYLKEPNVSPYFKE